LQQHQTSGESTAAAPIAQVFPSSNQAAAQRISPCMVISWKDSY